MKKKIIAFWGIEDKEKNSPEIYWPLVWLTLMANFNVKHIPVLKYFIFKKDRQQAWDNLIKRGISIGDFTCKYGKKNVDY